MADLSPAAAEAITWRWYLHSIPEPGSAGKKPTSSSVADRLAGFGVEAHRDIAGKEWWGATSRISGPLTDQSFEVKDLFDLAGYRLVVAILECLRDQARGRPFAGLERPVGAAARRVLARPAPVETVLASAAIFTFIWTWDGFFGPLVYLSDARIHRVVGTEDIHRRQRHVELGRRPRHVVPRTRTSTPAVPLLSRPPGR